MGIHGNADPCVRGVSSPSASKRSVQRAVSGLEPGVKHRKEQLAGRETVWHVFTLGCYTHRIRVAVEELPKGPETRLPPRIAIVIDDLGYDLEIARAFMQLETPVSLSVLPSAPHAPLIARETQERGYDVLLHLPMEAKRSHRVSMGSGRADDAHEGGYGQGNSQGAFHANPRRVWCQ